MNFLLHIANVLPAIQANGENQQGPKLYKKSAEFRMQDHVGKARFFSLISQGECNFTSISWDQLK